MLATSADVESVYAVPTGDRRAPKSTATALCHALKDCTPDFLATLTHRLSKEERAFQFVKRHVSPEEAAAVRALKLDGIGFMSESHRFYPNRDLLGPVLGYVGLDNNGLAGIEKRFEETIRGKDGKVVVVTDAKRHAFDRLERPPTAGASIELTIDSVLQHDVERELARGVIENRAEDGVAVVMDPWTGEILAMASYPDYNPNIAGRLDPDALHNPAVEQYYEPGSTFKTVTASAALEEKLVTPDTLIDCSPGYIDINAKRRVHDTHEYGVLSFTDVIVKSSNVGAIKTGFKVGPDRLEQYVRRFGFGMQALQELPAESAGSVWSRLSDDALASVSMGYQIGVTPVQMAAAVSSIANGGVLMRPRLVRATVRGGVRQPVAPEAIRRTVSAETAATLTTIMEGVVERGTGKPAQIDGYTIAGKTGTAAKVVNGKYSKEKYFSSFVAFMPSRKPVITVVVMIDSASAGQYYGGTVAGPVFKRIAEIATRRLGIPRTVNPEQPVVVTPLAALGDTRTVKFVAPRPQAAPGQEGVMPDLRGLSARAAVRTLARVGLVPRLAGSGFVTGQQPDAGSPLRGDEAVTLKLAREVDVPAGDSARQ